MNYELAKELKDAGFPQYEEFVMSAEDISPQSAHRYRDHRTFDLSLLGYPKSEPDYYEQGKWRSSCIFSKKYLESEDAETLYFPTLEELIEACGLDDFLALFQNMEEGENRWCAQSRPDYRKQAQSGFGSTPTEAVARLWLALHPTKS